MAVELPEELARWMTLWLDNEARLTSIADRTGVTVEELLGMLEQASTSEASGALSTAELSVLTDAGISLSGPAQDPTGTTEVVRGRVAARQILDTALSVPQAAKRLGVGSSRVRQMVSAGELAVIRRPEGNLLPAWQFDADSEVPGLAVALAQAGNLHPLTLAGLMTRPNIDLIVDGEPVSPVAWLRSGGDAQAVADLVSSDARA